MSSLDTENNCKVDKPPLFLGILLPYMYAHHRENSGIYPTGMHLRSYFLYGRHFPPNMHTDFK
jgi:hypothetical protein